MKTDLVGLAQNVADELESKKSGQKKMYAFVMRELAEHVEGVRSGKYTAEQFMMHYSIAKETK